MTFVSFGDTEYFCLDYMWNMPNKFPAQCTPISGRWKFVLKANIIIYKLFASYFGLKSHTGQNK